MKMTVEEKIKLMNDRVSKKWEKYRLEIETRGEVECGKCGQVKRLDEFPPGRKTRKGKPRYAYCRPCHSEYQRVNRLKTKFNLTLEDYEKILSLQGGKCAICRNPPKTTRRLAVDHDHKTGLIRGLLCSFCNRAIGLFRDNLFKFEQTVSYLKVPPATVALGEERFGIKGRSNNKAATIRRLNKEMFEKPLEEKNKKPKKKKKAQ